MEGFPLFIYWAYLVPAMLAVAFGVLAVERGRIPKEFGMMTRNAQYLNVIFGACIPFLNIVSVLAYAAINLGKEQ